MSTQTTRDENREQLQELLRDLFQFDAADLDFGVYRIMNQRRDRIEQFIEEDLLDAVDGSLKSLADAKRAEIEEELEEKAAELRQDWDDDIFNPDGSLKDQYANLGQKDLEEYQDLWETREDVAVAEETEARIFNDLYRFFSRYYEDGDFHTKRRISSKDSKYYVPYNGEETYFHWANNDQYYVKTGEHFTDYRFDTGEWTVEFCLEEADVPQDNVKGDSRHFMLGRGDPVSTDSDKQTVTIRFQYRQITEDEADDYVEAYNEATGNDRSSFAHMDTGMRCDALETRILSYIDNREIERLLITKKGDDDSTLLTSHLTRYVSENTMDFFVHKDLQEFLTGELEFFLQNEVLNAADIIQADDNASPPVLRARTVREIANRIISFLAQIEDFQKRLFEKKKFVVQTDYMITLDHLSDELYEHILENDEQIDHWRDIYNMGQWDTSLTWHGEIDETFLNNNPHLMIDTALFDDEFKFELLSSFENIDQTIDGILFHGENFQIINLLQSKYQERVDFVYLDPPYNTDSTPILYKNKYKHSSWLSLMCDRLELTKTLLGDDSLLNITIDDNEMSNLVQLLQQTYPTYDIDPVVIEHNYRGRAQKNFSVTHEYSLWAIPDGRDLITKKKETSDDIERNLRRTGAESLRSDRPTKFYGIEVDNETLDIVSVTDHLEVNEPIPENNNPDTTVVWPIDSNGLERRWYYGRERVLEEVEEGTVWAKRINGEIQIHYFQEGTRKRRKTVWRGSQLDASTYGTELLNDMFGPRVFDFPKSLHAVKRSIETATFDEDAVIMDYFAGSGTTAHAAIELNREDGGNRQYILGEMGDHFETVIRPRIMKAVFASSWDDGIPEDRDGLSQIVKYHQIESYEDALNNITLTEPESSQQKLVNQEMDDYVLGYMLDFESQESASLLPEGAFDEPFNHELKIEQNGTSREPTTVDLVETFHYLIGADVEQCWHESHQDRKYIVTECEVDTESGVEKVLTAWRRTEDIDYDEEKGWFDDEFDSESYDRVYVNGESQIAQAEPLEITFREEMEESPNVA